MILDRPYNPPSPDNVTSINALLYFIWEREAIRIAKVNRYNGELTQDPILKKYKFTNIRRKDDRVSKWIINNIILNAEINENSLWFTLLIARLINWPPTLQHLIDCEENILLQNPHDFNPKSFSLAIEKFRETNSKAYSGAYMVYPTKKDIGSVKSLSLGKHIIKPVLNIAEEVDYILYTENSIEKFVNVLSNCFGISTFIAGQVAADLTYCEAPLNNALDLYTYAPIGPGSSKGLNYLLGRKPYAEWKQEDFNDELKDINEQIKSNLEITDLTLHDVQNIMCEYSKYARTLLGQGKPKTMYKPEENF